MFKKIIRRSLFIFVSVLSLGAVYQFVGTKIDETLYPAPGNIVDIGGYHLHIHCMGNNHDGPTVILDAGLGYDSLDWSLIQPEIAKFAPVCSYDRAGYGWSDESLFPRTSKQIVEELHSLLQNAQIFPPYIFVGHSFGGVNSRLYAATYPEEIAGIVLVDSSHENQMQLLPPDDPENFIDASMENPFLRFAMIHTGALRLLYHLPQYQEPFHCFSKDVQSIYLAHLCSPKYIAATYSENLEFENSLKQLREINSSLEDTPLIVITACKPMTVEEMGYPEILDDTLRKWDRMQKEMVAKSTRGKQYFATRSTHMITHEQPEIVIKAVREMTQEMKKSSL